MTAQHVLEAGELALLLQLAGLTPEEASPLPPAPPIALDSAGAQRLRERGLLLDDGGAVRVNMVFREVLTAAAQPEEVLALRITGAEMPGFASCRRGRVWTESATTTGGTTHFQYPLSRNAMIVAAASALSSGRPEVLPVGFHFRGSAADGLLLNVLARAGGRGVPSSDPGTAVRHDVEQHIGGALTAALADPAGTRALIEGDVEEGIVRLRAAGHVEEVGDRLLASRKARAALGAPPEAGFTASHTTVGSNPGPGIRTAALQVWRCNGRNLVVRPVILADGTPGIDWADYQLAELRSLLAALYAISPD